MLWAISVRVDEIRAISMNSFTEYMTEYKLWNIYKNMEYHVYMIPDEIKIFSWWQKWDDYDK